MLKEIKESSEIEGEITITLEEDDYIKDFKNAVTDFKKRFTRNGFRGVSTPNSVIYAEYGYDILYQICRQKASEVLKGITNGDFFSKNVYSDVILVSSTFPSRNNNIVYTSPGSFSFIFQYGFIKNVVIDDSSVDRLKELVIPKERCLDLSKENLEFFTKKIYFNLLKNGKQEDLNKVNLSDLDFNRVNISSLFLNDREDIKAAELKWLFDDFDIKRLIKPDVSSISEIKCDEFQSAVKENVIFILNTILRKKFRSLLREKCIDLFQIDVPINYLRAKIKSMLKDANSKIVEHYLPLFNNTIKWECIRTVMGKKYDISSTEKEALAYDVVYKYLSDSSLFKEYNELLANKMTLGTYDDFNDKSLAVIDLKVINMVESICKIQIVDVSCDHILNEVLK